jgi:hypothetical protein
LANAWCIGHLSRGSNTPLALRGASTRRNRNAARDHPCRHGRPEQDLSQGKRRSPGRNRPSSPGLRSCHPFQTAQSGRGHRPKILKCVRVVVAFSRRMRFPLRHRADIFVLGQLIRHSSCRWRSPIMCRRTTGAVRCSFAARALVRDRRKLQKRAWSAAIRSAHDDGLPLHAYCSGLYSSRRIAKACADRSDLMMIVAHDASDFRTIADLRKRHLPPRGRLFFAGAEACEKSRAGEAGHVALEARRSSRTPPNTRR